MCTVTYLPGKDGILLTSNRDEKQYRSLALIPHSYSNHLGKVMYPRDPDGGGTWIAVHENRNAIVFLNGGFEGHQPNPPYRRSRGLILLDLLACERPSLAFKDLSLNDVEPFTAVIWDASELLTCVWDGNDKHRVHMDPAEPHIWSSSTLYTHQVREKRASWFEGWLAKGNEYALDNIMDFHRFGGEGDAHNDLLMNRAGKVFTVSITGLEISTDKASMVYHDLREEKKYARELAFSPAQPGTLV